ncbi:hypothetical protein [Vibrio sp. TRT 1302]|uniref:hypothetical protein n=1 Tax=Vibrio sp. TRT 1302 TaxID=3418504 RepID=UPI003CE81D41
MISLVFIRGLALFSLNRRYFVASMAYQNNTSKTTPLWPLVILCSKFFTGFLLFEVFFVLVLLLLEKLITAVFLFDIPYAFFI